MRKPRRLARLALLPVLVTFAGCDPFGPSNDLLIVPADPRLIPSERLKLEVEYEDGSRPFGSVTWSSSDPGVVSVDDYGLATGVTLGSATLTAEAGDERASTTVTVVPVPVSCVEEGTVHDSATIESATWRTADGPHRLTARIAIEGTLTIAAGTLVCGETDGELLLLHGGRVDAVGTPEAPIVLTAVDPALPWGGIRGDHDPMGTLVHSARLVHVLLEHGVVGVIASEITIDSSLIRKTQGSGVSGGRSFIRGSVIEDACLGGGTGAVIASDGGVLEYVKVLNSGCAGVSGGLGTTDLIGVRIEGSAGPGLSFSQRDLAQGRIAYGKPGRVESLRITGGASYPIFRMAAADAAELLEAVPADSLTGNARDTLIIHDAGPPVTSDVRITASLPWAVADASFREISPIRITGTVKLEPGSGLQIGTSYPVIFESGGRLLAEGTAEDVITIRRAPYIPPPLSGENSTMLILRDVPVDTSRLSHVRIVDLPLSIGDEHPVIMTDVVFESTTLDEPWLTQPPEHSPSMPAPHPGQTAKTRRQ